MSSEKPVTADQEILAAWRVIGDLLRAGTTGQESLAILREADRSLDGLKHWLSSAPLAEATRTVVTGGVVEKLVNIAHAEAVYVSQPAQPAQVKPAQLPFDHGPFSGRHSKLAEVKSLLLSDEDVPSLVYITGPGGIGKTKLALHAAHEIRSNFPDGQLYINLKGIDRPPPTHHEIVGSFLRAIAGEDIHMPSDDVERAALLRSHLAHRQVLIMLDNAASSQQVRALLPGVGTCAVIVTTRMTFYDLEPAQIVRLDVLTSEEALELFSSIVGRERVSAEAEAAETILRLCGYLPLAVHIAARRMAHRPLWRLGVLATRLADERRRLDELAAGDLGVRSAFNLSYETLSAPQQRAFKYVGLVHIPRMSTRDVQMLLECGEDEAQELVEDLISAHLLLDAEVDPSGQIRFSMHDLVALFSQERAEEEESAVDLQAAKTRLRRGYMKYSAEIATCLRPLLPAGRMGGDVQPQSGGTDVVNSALAWFDREIEGVTEVLRDAHRDGAWSVVVSVANAAHSYLLRKDRPDEWLELSELGFSAAQASGDQIAVGLMSRNMAEMYRNNGDYVAAARCSSVSVSTFDRLQEIDDTAFARIIHYDICRYQGRLVECVEGLERARDEFKARSHARGAAYAAMDLGSAYRSQSRWSAAAESFESALGVIDEYQDFNLRAHVMRELGCVHRELGLLEQARSEISEALALARLRENRRSEAHCLRELGVTQALLGDLAVAESQIHQASTLFRAIHDLHGTAYADRDCARLAMRRRDGATALVHLQLSNEGMRLLGDVRGEALNSMDLGAIELESGSVSEGREHLERSLASFQTLGMDQKVDEALVLLRSAAAKQ